MGSLKSCLYVTNTVIASIWQLPSDNFYLCLWYTLSLTLRAIPYFFMRTESSIRASCKETALFASVFEILTRYRPMLCTYLYYHGWHAQVCCRQTIKLLLCYMGYIYMRFGRIVIILLSNKVNAWLARVCLGIDCCNVWQWSYIYRCVTSLICDCFLCFNSGL